MVEPSKLSFLDGTASSAAPVTSGVPHGTSRVRCYSLYISMISCLVSGLEHASLLMTVSCINSSAPRGPRQPTLVGEDLADEILP